RFVQGVRTAFRKDGNGPIEAARLGGPRWCLPPPRHPKRARRDPHGAGLHANRAAACCEPLYFPLIASSSTSNTSVAPPGMVGGCPWSPYAMSEGHTSRAFSPTFILPTPSVQHLM